MSKHVQSCLHLCLAVCFFGLLLSPSFNFSGLLACACVDCHFQGDGTSPLEAEQFVWVCAAVVYCYVVLLVLFR